MITLDGYVQLQKYRYLYFVIMLTVYILIITLNSTIVYIIWIHRNLHEPMYVFIAALLVNSVLFSTAIYPKLLIDFLSEEQITSYSACICQGFLFYSLGGAEFFLLAAMAFDRYVSICRPLQYPTIMRKTTVIIFLVLAWLLPACQLVGSAIQNVFLKLCNFTIRGIFCNNFIYKLHCIRPRAVSIFGLIVMINVALLPVLFILFTYTRILIVSYRSCRVVRKKAAQTCLPHLMVLISFSCLCLYDVVILRVESDFPKTANFVMSFQIVLYHPLFNPIVYGLKMKEIYKHLKNLFH
ncbi:olfactory receptor 11A1-like [Halichoeres trimaculatus]|uniref:olfactory receptor 11A1-like n=1 Tax=Halichoeres trimaculatus TaxID=147232 RepID=UPI003D9F455C